MSLKAAGAAFFDDYGVEIERVRFDIASLLPGDAIELRYYIPKDDISDTREMIYRRYNKLPITKSMWEEFGKEQGWIKRSWWRFWE